MNKIKKMAKSPGIQMVFWTAVILIMWELCSRFGLINSYLLPSCSDVMTKLYEEVVSGNFLMQIFNSFYMIVYGFVLSTLLACVIITLCVCSKVFTSFVKTVCTLMTPLPGVAIMPIIIMIFGIDTKAMLVLMIHSVMWPLIINVLGGINLIPKTITEYANNIELSKFRMFSDVYLFAIMPCVLSGLKVGWGRSWRALISAEMVFGMIGNLGGIGYYIYTNRAYGNMPKVMVGVVAVIIIGIVVEYVLFGLLEKFTVKRWGMNNE